MHKLNSATAAADSDIKAIQTKNAGYDADIKGLKGDQANDATKFASQAKTNAALQAKNDAQDKAIAANSGSVSSN